jgi:hypothetical protein
MRIILAAVPLALFAACNSGAANNAAANDSGAANAAAPAPAANEAKPAEAQAAADPRRAGEIAECVQDVQSEVEPGTDVQAFCGCAVDRIQGGRGEREAMDQCAAELGVRERQR